MGRRKGRKKIRRQTRHNPPQERRTSDGGQGSEVPSEMVACGEFHPSKINLTYGAGAASRDQRTETSRELPPLSPEGLKAALRVAPLERIEIIRRA